ncbi:MAG: HDOD domain-containing protein [Pseudomonadota bacterium]
MDAGITVAPEEQILNGLFIPPCPATLTSIMREARSPLGTLDKIAHLIGSDAGLVAPLLKLANSPLMGLRNKVTSVMHAVSLLGLQNTLNLVHNIALRQSLEGNGQSFEKFWERSSLAATVAEKIAARFPGVSRDDAYIAALFHDCGIPVLIQRFPDYREKVMSQGARGVPICETENAHFFTNHAVVGHMLTRSWALPAQVCKAILFHHDTTIFTAPGEQADDSVLDLIAVMHLAEFIVDEHLHVRDKEWPLFEHDVLRHFDLTEQEFAELKGDMLAYLNGD